MDYKLGGKYKISATRKRQRKNWDGFKGEIMQHNKRFFTLQNRKGIRESFLKINMQIGEYGIQNL